ncbi:ABC transporter permease [Streptomyces rhizosphaerihabitans]|uniref:ABC transporter permease n=1 Tax=Streptomyces rhizosphaerihabitans TaxID=1266770 RepID=UPI0021BF37CE|nr:ABC transporter permease [Streptomyces rhizosphaerihabitans]MCT9010434.1 ABC transporter permease [Streptomyces rhizosphaerihabitans]
MTTRTTTTTRNAASDTPSTAITDEAAPTPASTSVSVTDSIPTSPTDADAGTGTGTGTAADTSTGTGPAAAPAPPAPVATEADGAEAVETKADSRRFRRSPRPRRRGLAPGKRLPASRLIGPALFLALWAVASAAGQLDPGAIPAPWTVLRTTGHLWTDGTLPTDVLTSLERAGYGFGFGLTAGVVLALASGLSRVGEALIDGTVQLNRAIPTLGLIPLFILWLGIGETFKIAIIAIVVYIPIYLNLHSALSGIDHRYVELAEVQGLSRLRFVREIVIPGALPGFFVGLRLGVTASWLSLVVLEQINATSGLGYMMFQAQNYGRTDIILVGLLIYGIFGLVSDSAVRLIERKVLSWRRTLSS